MPGPRPPRAPKPPKPPRAPRRPDKLVVGPLHARVVRGPHRDDPARWYWQAVLHADGGTRTVWSGWSTAADVTRRLADLVAAGPEALLARTAARAGGAGAGGRQRAPSSPDALVVRELLEVFLAWQLGRTELSASRRRTTQADCERLALGVGDVLVTRLGTAALEDYVATRLRQGAATTTINNELSTLVQAWRWGGLRGLAPERQLKRPRMKVTPARPKYILDAPEFWNVVDALPAHRPWLRTMALLLEATGARPGEVAALVWSDVAWERRRIRLGAHEGARKTGERWAVVSEHLLEELRAVRPAGEDGQPVTSGRVLPVTHGSACVAFRVAWGKACAAAGVPHAPPKQLRAMVENRLFDAGADPGVVSAQLGHSAQTSLQHYRAARAARVEEVLAAAGVGSRPDSKVVSLAARRRKVAGADEGGGGGADH